ncbi:uroporphyrin-III C-methyltransferase [Mucor circinelloides]
MLATTIANNNADIMTPVPQGGASLMIAFRCHRKNVLVVGHDEIAASRVLSALEADAQVTVVGPLDRMCKELVYRIQNSQVEWAGESFEEEQLIGNHLVFVSRSDDIGLCQYISHACCARRIPINVANQKDLSDFDMTCSYRDQSLQVAVSTNGLSSVNLANRILQSKISCTLEPSLGEAVKNAGLLRKGAEALDPGSSSSLRRYQWLTHICDTKSLEEMAALTATDISELLASYSKEVEGGLHHL